MKMQLSAAGGASVVGDLLIDAYSRPGAAGRAMLVISPWATAAFPIEPYRQEQEHSI